MQIMNWFVFTSKEAIENFHDLQLEINYEILISERL